MADGIEIARAKVTIQADLEKYDASMREVQNKTSQKILALEQSIKAQMAKAKLALKITADPVEIIRLNSQLDILEKKLKAVGQAAVNQAAKLQQFGKGDVPFGPANNPNPNNRQPGSNNGGGGRGVSNFNATSGAMALMQLGAAIDDVQYGFRGVLNNIPMMVTGFAQMTGASTSLSMGLGAVAAILLTVVYQVVTHWGELMDMMGTGKVKTEAEEMEALAKAISRTAEEEEKLAKYRRTQKMKEELFEPGGPEGEEEKDRRNETKENIEKAGARAVAVGVAAAKEIEGTAPMLSNQELDKRIGNRQNERKNLFMRNYHGAMDSMFGTPEFSKSARDREQQRYRMEYAQNLVAKAATGDEQAIQQINALRKRNVTLFPAKLEEGETAEQRRKRLEKEDIDNWTDAIRDMRLEKGRAIADEFAKGDFREALLYGPTQNLRPAVEHRLRAAGFREGEIKTMATAIINELENKVNREVKERSVGKNISEADARKMLAEELTTKKELRAAEKDNAIQNAKIGVRRAEETVDDYWKEKNKPKFMGFEEYFKKLTLGGFTTEDDTKKLVRLNEDAATAREQLRLAILKQKLAGFAVP